MYSPRIYESQVPSIYHAAQSMEVPMTQLVNAFVYYGLATGDYGTTTSALLPQPNQVLPEGVLPKMPIFNSYHSSVQDYLLDPRITAPKNATFQQLIELTIQDVIHRSRRREKGQNK